MTNLRRSILKISLIFLSLSIFTACTIETRGITVREYQQTLKREETASNEAREQAERETLAAMARVKENSVFREVNGVPEYIIGPGDVLAVNFWTIAVAGAQTFEGFKQISYNIEVRDDGRISFMYGDDMKVSGLTTREVKEMVTRELKKYFRDPRLEVFVKEYKSKSANLFGQINVLPTGQSGPGRYFLKGKTTVLDLISQAGGAITGRSDYTNLPSAVAVGQQNVANADLQRVELVRKGKRYILNLYKAMFYGDETQNPVLDSGDIVTVPAQPYFAERVYVMGQVKNIGIQRLQDAPDLLSAIAMAGGTQADAVKTEVKIIREFRERQGNPIVISANYDAIIKQGKLDENIKLQSGDVVYVPRMLIGDINEFIVNTTPLLQYLLIPGSYRDTYGSPNQLRY
ncbi:MAG TPA: polysaccharide biosynthesis/export family protein [Syntrophales bacterium]|nr:polysaccharide biosynthesis/export family protein [Syntrophales bacterium]